MAFKDKSFPCKLVSGESRALRTLVSRRLKKHHKKAKEIKKVKEVVHAVKKVHHRKKHSTHLVKHVPRSVVPQDSRAMLISRRKKSITKVIRRVYIAYD